MIWGADYNLLLNLRLKLYDFQEPVIAIFHDSEIFKKRKSLL